MSDLERLRFSFFNAEVMARYLSSIAEGFLVTVELALVIIVTGLLAGLALALIRSAHLRPVSWAIVFFVDLFRALPPLVVLVLFYFALPHAGLRLSGFAAAWASLSLVLAAFAEEIFWAGILAVHKGQWEAARSTGLTQLQTLTYIVIPQATRNVLPDLIGNTLEVVKLTSLASVVALPELLYATRSAQSVTFNASPLVAAAVLYFVLLWPVVRLLSRLEHRLLVSQA